MIVGATLTLVACSGDSDGGEPGKECPAADEVADAGAGTRDPAGDGGADAAALPEPPAVTALSNIAPTQVPAAPRADLRIASQCEFDSEAGTFHCANFDAHEGEFAFSVVEPGDGSRYGVISVRSLQIDPQGVVSVRGDLPLVIVAQDTLQVFGRISVAAHGRTAYAGGFAPNDSGGVGYGPGAGQRGVLGHFLPSSGGSFCGTGGRGATPDSSPGVEGGASYGSPALSPLVGGSSGGGPEGGAGGGAIQLVAGNHLQIGPYGVVDAGGGGGGNTSSGGGAGGAILLEAKQVIVEGVLAANGGGGGAAQGGSGGQDGRPDATAASGEIPTLGGQGSAGDDKDGSDGMFMTENQALGGGGGAGRIHIRSADGTAMITGVLSPTLVTGCASVAQL